MKNFSSFVKMLYYLCRPGSSTHEGAPTEEGANYQGESSDGGRSPESVEDRTEEKERRMEERKMKVLNVLSKLQDDTPRQNKSSKGCSNFEDCKFEQSLKLILLFFNLSSCSNFSL